MPAVAACFADYRAGESLAGQACTTGSSNFPMQPATPRPPHPRLPAGSQPEAGSLLQVISVFDESGLDARRSDAGAYFLRF
jgi:hypothetical protein